ncbi:hypothetical protein FOMPIDRAFT_1155361 [Fomitopsis schrenkii]|uniref:Protein-lysine N-methyltransferase EFM4 n=1 Tax=Fomitopsis schrenkii TaxID=2126942 RepID=S8EN03_FOMSC|nr:hypothetical protein FOMPIDRAFT_1155361 [Fomitopsis schrenkii]
MSSIDLPPSKLGTKKHWDGVYSSELTNFKEIGDEGEVWFGEDSVEKMVDWALEHVAPDPPPSILEAGAGNGNLLFALHEAGYAPGRICGLDYSADAVKLARAIALSKAQEGDASGEGPDMITFIECDFLAEDVPPLHSEAAPATWDLVLDKGTFDAMALAGQDVRGVNIADGYPSRIGRAVKPGGYFLITSCNFTEEELKSRFAAPETGLTYHSRIPFPSFSFGGKSGNVYSSVAFQKQP